MKFIILLLTAILAINALTTEQSFKLWMDKHNRNYINDMEYVYRLGVYRSNVEFIEEHNMLNKGFTVAINKFADLTAKEFASLYNGRRVNGNNTRLGKIHAVDEAVEVADSVDWREKGVVTGVKNQKQCGSCWAFSATGAVEGAWAIKYGAKKLVSLSEQNLIDCSGDFGNYGCDGGLMDNAFEYIFQNRGIDTEASYPYTGSDGSCKYSAGNIGATIYSYADVNPGSERELTNAIATAGPVSVAIDASQASFQFYSSGVYYEPSCSSYQLDHGVLAVGYGNQNSQDFYIVKNSWGPEWGSNGYILMARNKHNNCGIASAASYPLV